MDRRNELPYLLSSPRFGSNGFLIGGGRAAPLNLQSRRRWSRGDPSNEGIVIHLPTSHHGQEEVLCIPISYDWNYS